MAENMKKTVAGPALTALAVVLGAGLVLAWSARAIGAEKGISITSPVIDPQDIKPGMKGYGLTVLKGSEPVRFEVKVVDVVPRALPKQDMILVMCSGQGLEKTRVIAGMSGSPVFIEGRLAGAVAYAWPFSEDPLAGVTPIGNMRDSALKGPALASAGKALVLAERSGADGPEGIKRIATPLMAGGFSSEGLALLEREFKPMNMMPVAGGAMSDSALSRSAADDMVPGSAVGAALMTGDLSLTAIGTLTWREGDMILAFGHPFMRGGPISMPLVKAKIHTVVNTSMISFKMGSPQAVVGELVMDDQAAIVGRLGVQPPMTPFKIKVTRPSTSYSGEFNMEMAREPALSPVLIRIGLMEAARSAAPALEATTVRMKSVLALKDHGSVSYQDVYAILKGSFSMGFLDPVLFLSMNPFDRVEFEGLEVEMEVTDELSVATIESVWTDTDEVEPGGSFELSVDLKPYGANEPVRYSFSVEVPESEGLKALPVLVTGGSLARPDEALPKSLPDMLRYMSSVYPSDNLVVSYRAPGQGVDVKGTRLRKLPPSVTSVLQPANTTGNAPVAARVIKAVQTPYVVLGAKRVVLAVGGAKKESRRR